mmetsp:Transcript_40917/g.126344  ORF Transcript_40917/g.126344 Transcript_40917/m.126344 type:complete len:84 (-) Transcript_40917:642-893(-)
MDRLVAQPHTHRVGPTLPFPSGSTSYFFFFSTGFDAAGVAVAAPSAPAAAGRGVADDAAGRRADATPVAVAGFTDSVTTTGDE